MDEAKKNEAPIVDIALYCGLSVWKIYDKKYFMGGPDTVQLIPGHWYYILHLPHYVIDAVHFDD